MEGLRSQYVTEVESLKQQGELCATLLENEHNSLNKSHAAQNISCLFKMPASFETMWWKDAHLKTNVLNLLPTITLFMYQLLVLIQNLSQ